MKTCFKCLRQLPRSEFYAHPQMGDGLLGKCKDCTKADVSRNYRQNRERFAEYERARALEADRKARKIEYQRRSRKENPEKWSARAAVARAVRAGAVVRLPCVICGNPKSQAHHEDYSRPLDVTWLCFKHHREAHGQVVVTERAA